MRIQLTLKALEKSPTIPTNYQYPLSAAIYKILNQAEPQFAELLHSKGYPTGHNQRFKYFTFSKLFFKYPAKVNKNVLLLDSTNQPFLLISSPPSDKEMKFEVDKDYVVRRGGENNVSKLIRIKKGEPEETNARGFIAPFVLSGSLELIKLAYQCGIGEKNSMRFGMFEAIHSAPPPKTDKKITNWSSN